MINDITPKPTQLTKRNPVHRESERLPTTTALLLDSSRTHTKPLTPKENIRTQRIDISTDSIEDSLENNSLENENENVAADTKEKPFFNFGNVKTSGCIVGIESQTPGTAPKFFFMTHVKSNIKSYIEGCLKNKNPPCLSIEEWQLRHTNTCQKLIDEEEEALNNCIKKKKLHYSFTISSKFHRDCSGPENPKSFSNGFLDKVHGPLTNVKFARLAEKIKNIIGDTIDFAIIYPSYDKTKETTTQKITFVLRQPAKLKTLEKSGISWGHWKYDGSEALRELYRRIKDLKFGDTYMRDSRTYFELMPTGTPMIKEVDPKFFKLKEERIQDIMAFFSANRMGTTQKQPGDLNYHMHIFHPQSFQECKTNIGVKLMRFFALGNQWVDESENQCPVQAFLDNQKLKKFAPVPLQGTMPVNIDLASKKQAEQEPQIAKKYETWDELFELPVDILENLNQLTAQIYDEYLALKETKKLLIQFITGTPGLLNELFDFCEEHIFPLTDQNSPKKVPQILCPRYETLRNKMSNLLSTEAMELIQAEEIDFEYTFNLRLPCQQYCLDAFASLLVGGLSYLINRTTFNWEYTIAFSEKNYPENVNSILQLLFECKKRIKLLSQIESHTDQFVSTHDTDGSKMNKFFEKVFNPLHQKVSILVMSGLTNDGKSFSTKVINRLLLQLNGAVIGSEIDSGFVRVDNLGARMLKIVEEYKGNLLMNFQHLEANGKQLRQNNAIIDSRINLAIICCDKENFSIDDLGKELLQKKGLVNNKNSEVFEFDFAKESILSKVGQVKSRTYVINWHKSGFWGGFRSLSLEICQIQSQISKMQRKLQVMLGTKSKVFVGENQIFQLWNVNTSQKQTLLESWGLFLSHHTAWGRGLQKVMESVVANQEPSKQPISHTSSTKKLQPPKAPQSPSTELVNRLFSGVVDEKHYLTNNENAQSPSQSSETFMIIENPPQKNYSAEIPVLTRWTENESESESEDNETYGEDSRPETKSEENKLSSCSMGKF